MSLAAVKSSGCSESASWATQCAIVVEAIDFNIMQADLVVGIDGHWVQETADVGEQEFVR